MILLIDNYDSFAYNLFQMVGTIDPNIKVIRNDELSLEEIRGMAPRRIILSPGPGRPADAGLCEEVARKLSEKIPILGVCLGHQAICEAFGGAVTYAKRLMHGKSSLISADLSCPIFAGPEPLPKRFQVARYHSLAAPENALSSRLRVTARAEDGEVMAVMHEDFPVFGLQFHPESILTPNGASILKNFVTGDFPSKLMT